MTDCRREMLLPRTLLIAIALLGSLIDSASPDDKFALSYNESWNYENEIPDGSSNEYGDANSDATMLLDQAEALSTATGSISLNFPMKNMSKPAGEKAQLVCEITGDPRPKYIWLKDGKAATKDDRIVAQDTAWGHRLRIDGLLAKDEGWYTCVANNPFGSANTSAYLKVSQKQQSTVTQSNKQNSVPQSAASGSTPAKGDEFSAENLAKDGLCQEFSVVTCAKHLQSHMVVANPKKTMQSQRWRESRLAEMFDSISQLDNITSSSSCTPEILISALCLYAFPTCNDSLINGQQQKATRVRTMCYSECERLKEVVCRDQLDSLSEHLREEFDIHLMLDCPRLLNVPSAQDAKTCQSLRSLLPASVFTSLFDEECYTQNGAEYNGKVQTSASGQQCRRWTSVPEYAHVGSHSYCRNPNGERDSPWCFVADRKPESCNINRCSLASGTAADGPYSAASTHQRPVEPESPVSDSIVILVPSIASPIVIAVILMIVFIWKRSTASSSKSSATFTFISHSKGSAHASRAASNTRTSNSAASSTAHSAKKLASSKASSVVSVLPTNVPDYPVSRIRFVQELGSGPFGKIYRGDLLSYVDTSTHSASSMPIFIKSLRPGATNKMQQDFQREIQLMSELLHPNLLNLIGVCMHDHPWCMLFEFVQFGHLHEFLILHSPTQSDNLSLSDDNTVTSLLQTNRKTLTFADQVHIAKEVASGMEFLASRRFVHRDLAARNVLIGHNLSCKICDFGIAVDAYSCDYYKVQNGAVLLPVRWMAPEAVAHNQFSLETDVFSYGVLLWEIFSYGMQPYFGYSNQEVIEMVKNHQILACPDECPVRMYALMVECWNLAPMQRPHFRDISSRLRTWLSELDCTDRIGLAQPVAQYYLRGPAGPLERFISIQQNASAAAAAAGSAPPSMLTQEALECLNALTKSEYAGAGQSHFALTSNDANLTNAYASSAAFAADLTLLPQTGASQPNSIVYLQPADGNRVAITPALTQRARTVQSAASSGVLHYARQQANVELDPSSRRSAYQHAQSVTGAGDSTNNVRHSRKNVGVKQSFAQSNAGPAFQQIQPNSPPIVIDKHSSSSLINRNNLIYPSSTGANSERMKRKNSNGSHPSEQKLTPEYGAYSSSAQQIISTNSNGMTYSNAFLPSSTGGIRNPLDNHPLTSATAAALYIPVSRNSARSHNHSSDSDSS